MKQLGGVRASARITEANNSIRFIENKAEAK